MKHCESNLILFIVLIAFQLSCVQARTVSINNSQNFVWNETVKDNSNSASVVEEKKNDTDYFAHLKPEHKEVLQEWLKKKPYLKPAVEKTDGNLDENKLKKNHSKGWTQFYTVADINKDGKEDFAILLVKVNEENKFAVAVFNGELRKGQSPTFFDENFNEISKVYIEYVNEKDEYFSSDSFLLLNDERGCVGFIPKKNVYESVVCI
jgi:hypothetical protein